MNIKMENNVKKEDFNMNRRNFIKTTTLGGAALYLGGGSLNFAQAAGDFNGQSIVTIFLRGGQDALSAVAPKNSNLINKKRPNIKFGMKNVGDDFFGINNQFSWKFNKLFNEKDMAIIHGVGGLNPTTSHFAQMDFIEGGDSKVVLNNGFLSRFSQVKNLSNTIALESKVPNSLVGQEYVMQVTNKNALSNIARLNGNHRNGISRSEFLSNFFGWGTFKAARETASTHSAKSSEIFNSIKSSSIGQGFRNPQLGLLAEMICNRNRGNYTLSIGGWDDHVEVKNKFAGRVNAMFDDLHLLVRNLKSAGEFKRTTILIYSEFGRRIGENGSKGSDHGRGGVAYVIGGKVKGGKIYKTRNFVNDTRDKFNASEVNPRHNLLVDIDIRQVYAQIFQKRFGLNNTQIKSIFNNDAAFSTSHKINFIS